MGQFMFQGNVEDNRALTGGVQGKRPPEERTLPHSLHEANITLIPIPDRHYKRTTGHIPYEILAN